MANIIDDLKMQYRTGGIELRLIFWNVGCFLMSIILFYKFSGGYFDYPNWIALSSDVSTMMFRPWTLLTYAFFHAGFFHLLFNMIILNFSARLFLTYFSSKQLIGLYILSAVFSGIVFVLLYNIVGRFGSIVGASGAIMAVLVAIAAYSPTMTIRLLLIGNVKLWVIAGVVVILDLMQVAIENTGGHIAHLAGAFFGFIFIKSLQSGYDMSKVVSNIVDIFANLLRPKQKSTFKKIHRNYSAPTMKPTKSQIVTKDKTQQQIDEILDKISRSGYESLTKAEKEFLFKAGK